MNKEKTVKYLGQLTWADAILKANDIGMVVPTFQIMGALIDSFRKDSDYFEANKYLSSTSFAYKTSEYVCPHQKIELTYGEDDEIETVKKETIRGAYAISNDLTCEDVKSGNYTFLTT